MRSWILSALVLAALGLRAASAQESPAPAPPAAAGERSGPIPYTELVQRAKRPSAHRPTPRPTSKPAASPPAPAQVRTVEGARLQAGQPIAPAELEAFVDGAVREAMRQRHIAGVTVSVVQNGQIVLKKGYGFASLSPARRVDPDRTLFRLGSLSKTFTWVGVMQAVEAGRIQLDQPVNLYLPKPVQVRDQGFEQPVRVVDLMSHSAGFEDRALGTLFERDPDYVRPLDFYLARERPRRVRPPGELPAYSNYGAALAGAAVADVAGKTFERVMEEQIFLPLHMDRTTFREARPLKAGLPAPMPESLAADAAQGYRWAAGGFEPLAYEYIGHIAPAGSASSTAADMGRYMLALLGDGRLGETQIFGPKAARAFRTPILHTPQGVNGWDHGFMARPLPGGRTGYGHAGDTLAFASNMVVAPDLGLGVFVAANTMGSSRFVDDLPSQIVGAFYAPPPQAPPPASQTALAAGRAFAGTYLSTRRAYNGLEGFVGRVGGASRVAVTPQGRLVTASVGESRAWVPIGEPAQGRFAAIDGDDRLVFQSSGGRPIGYRTSNGVEAFERVGYWRDPQTLALFALLTAAAAVASLVGAAVRNRRELRHTQIQSRAGLVQNIQGGLWLAAMVLFAGWAVRSLDPLRLIYGWPGPLLVTASACALVSAALTATTLVALPAVWRGGRRVESWSVLRKLGYSATVAIYTIFALLLARAGALSPWSA